MNLQENIDLLKLEKSCVRTIKGVRCLIIPIDMNDIYVSADKESLEAKGAYLNLNVYERREKSEHGATHYVKQSFSKRFKEGRPQEYEVRKKIYIGDAKPLELHSAQAVAPDAAVDDDSEMPF